MALEIKDLAGLSQPITKLIEVVSSGLGTAYRPRSMRAEADAKAYEVRTLAAAQAEAAVQAQAIQMQGRLDRVLALEAQNPELAARARQRLLAREIEGQTNVEQVVEHAVVALPEAVSGAPVSTAWRRRFFQEAENVCEIDMQELWGKVLAGEIAQPGSFGLRTLETLKHLSRAEAELFRTICRLVMGNGSVILPERNINTALAPFGITFDSILALRDAGLVLHGDGIHECLVSPLAATEPNPERQRVIVTNNGSYIQVSGPAIANTQLQVLVFSQAGRELRRLIPDHPNESYLSALGAHLRQMGLSPKRGTSVRQDENTTIMVFDQDL